MPARSRTSLVLERLALVVLSPLLFLAVAEGTIRLFGVETDLARNENAQIALPVWLLADEVWVADRRSKMEESVGEPIAAADVAWLYHFEEARWIQYKLKPGIDVQAVNPFNKIEVEKGVEFSLASNSDGFRDREFEPKRDGTVRILTLGDSSTFGWGVSPEHGFQRLLQDRLDAWQPGRFEVYNLGIPGHNSRHGLGVLRHYALALQPDILVLSYGANDGRYVPTPTDVVLEADDTALGAVRFAMLELKTYRLLRRLLLTWADPLRARPEQEAQAEERPLVQAVPPASFASNLEEMVRLGADAGARTLFVSVCTGVREYVDTMRSVSQARSIPLLDTREMFTNIVDALEAGEVLPELVSRYRDLYGLEAMSRQRSLYFTSDGCHPHWVGNTLIADRLFEMVQAAIAPPPAG